MYSDFLQLILENTDLTIFVLSLYSKKHSHRIVSLWGFSDIYRANSSAVHWKINSNCTPIFCVWYSRLWLYLYCRYILRNILTGSSVYRPFLKHIELIHRLFIVFSINQAIVPISGTFRKYQGKWKKIYLCALCSTSQFFVQNLNCLWFKIGTATNKCDSWISWVTSSDSSLLLYF